MPDLDLHLFNEHHQCSQQVTEVTLVQPLFNTSYCGFQVPSVHDLSLFTTTSVQHFLLRVPDALCPQSVPLSHDQCHYHILGDFTSSPSSLGSNAAKAMLT